jgi:YesN/AraC family two-component response regulator
VISDARTFNDALAKVAGESPEVLIVDLKFPGPNGEELGGLALIDDSLKMEPLLRVAPKIKTHY